MLRAPKLIAGIVIVTVIVIGLSLYAYFQSRDFLEGPVLLVETPPNGAVSTTSLITLKGSARNAAFLTLNGRQIFTDERGTFRESLLLQDGYTIITLEAKDRFGHTIRKELQLMYKPAALQASSTLYNP